MTTDPNAPDAALLPCPFCGETDAGIIRGDRGEPYVFCYCCEACGPLSKRDPVKLWNRRAGQAHERRADAGLLAALEEAHETMHQCTAVLTANDCAKVAAVMERCRAAITAAKGHDNAEG